jgi:hypothetical protein
VTNFSEGCSETSDVEERVEGFCDPIYYPSHDDELELPRLLILQSSCVPRKQRDALAQSLDRMIPPSARGQDRFVSEARRPS